MTATSQEPLLLVVEDSRAERRALEHELGRRFPGYRLASAEGLAAARAILDDQDVSVAVIDHLLGDGSGLELIDAYPAVASIVVTGTGSEHVAAEALRRGAVDYVIKEEGYRHLEQVERAIEAALARRGRTGERASARAHDGGTGVVRFGDFELDLDREELREAGEPREVHRTPMRLLVHLVQHTDRAVSKKDLLQEVWQGMAVSDMAIASALKELRQVLRDDGVHQRVIQTRRGHGYRFVAPLSISADASARGVSSRQPSSLAVLPLENLSHDPGQDYFAQGMTDSVIGALARLDSLRVISKVSVMRLRDRLLAPREIGRALGVDLLVTGSVAREGARVRIHAELLDLRSERVLWADHFDRKENDVLALESEVARAIARGIRLELTLREKARLNRSSPVDSVARDAFLSGMYQYRVYSRESVRTALKHFLSALERSPRYAEAYVAVAECYRALCSEFRAISADDATRLARSAAEQALELDPFLGEAHAVRGALLAYFEWRWTEAEAAFQRSVVLSPGDPACLMGYAKLEAALGRTESALDLAQRAVASDPLNLPLRLNFARVLWFDRRYDEALGEQLRVVSLEPRLALAHAETGGSLYHLGRFPEAVEHWRKAMALSGLSAEAQEALQRAFEQGGIGAYWRQWLERAEQVAREVSVPASWMWFPYAATGDFERAFEWLEHDVERRGEELAYLTVNPSYDPLRSHPRFQRLLHRMRLPEEA